MSVIQWWLTYFFNAASEYLISTRQMSCRFIKSTNSGLFPETTLLFRSLKKELHLRRLPVYLLLDTSGSMHGEPIEAVKNGVQTLLTTLKQDPYALETAYVSVITFDSSARQAVP